MLNELLNCLPLSELNLLPSLCLSTNPKNIESNTMSSNTEIKGFVRLNGKKQLITKSELEALISEFKQKARDTYDKNRLSSSYLLTVRSLINGVFQAEGS